MPELPEVENVCMGLRTLIGCEFIDYRVMHSKFDAYPLHKGRLSDIRRIGKWIVFNFDESRSLVAHLGMSGRFEITPPKQHIKHTRWKALIKRNNKTSILHFVDPRCMGHLRSFGKLETYDVMNDTALSEGSTMLGIGTDWLSPIMLDTKLVLQPHVLLDKFNSNRTLKALLLDQSLYAGLGNIYANEAAFSIGLHPASLGHRLHLGLARKLIVNVKNMLQTSISLGGTSFGDANNYVDVNGNSGSYASRLYVYGRARKPCKICNRLIKKINLNGRSTFFCDNCQELLT